LEFFLQKQLLTKLHEKAMAAKLKPFRAKPQIHLPLHKFTKCHFRK